MHKLVRSFVKSEDGAVTVDWVVLTAAILGIQIVVLIATMEDSMVEVSDSVGNKVTEYGDFLD
jgi:Flp pilus assembly pilin Flp